MQPQNLPPHVVEDAKWRLLDTIGVALAGSRMEYAAMVAGVFDEMAGTPEATTFAFGSRLPAASAGYVNAALSHGPDFDDTHSRATLHPSCIAVPAALAMAERVRASGAECITAMVVAAEIELRLGAAVPPHYFSDRGLHPVGLVGPFGAAAAASRLLRLEKGQIAHALGVAGTQHVGFMQQLLDGSWVKRLYPAAAVHSGITAALLAQRGFTGPTEILEGKFGFYATLARGEQHLVRLESIVEDLGKEWLYPETVFKIFPSGSATHTPMYAVASLIHETGVGSDDIERIECFMSPDRVGIVGEPRNVRLDPRTPYHMKFSLPYCVAMLVVLGHVEFDDFSDAVLADRRVAAMARRVYCTPDEQLPNQQYPARVTLETRDGRHFERFVAAQPGTRDNPLSGNDHRAKFLANARPSLGEHQADRLRQAIEGAWEADRVDAVLHLSVRGADQHGDRT